VTAHAIASGAGARAPVWGIADCVDALVGLDGPRDGTRDRIASVNALPASKATTEKIFERLDMMNTFGKGMIGG